MAATVTRAMSSLTEMLFDALERRGELPARDLCVPIAALTGAEFASWHEIDWVTGESRSALWPDPSLASRAERLLREQRAVHPLIRHYATTSDLTALTAAQVCGGTGRWRRSVAYDVLRGEFGMEQQLGLPVTRRGPLLRSFALSRSGRDFGTAERERAVAALRVVRVIDAHLAEGAHGVVPVPRQAPRPAAELTPREHQALAAMRGGALRHTAARRLGIAPRTLDKHLEHAYAKLGVGNLLSALHAADELGRGS
jgi:DNA-binding CsgD family transcriptional regulator